MADGRKAGLDGARLAVCNGRRVKDVARSMIVFNVQYDLLLAKRDMPRPFESRARRLKFVHVGDWVLLASTAGSVELVANAGPVGERAELLKDAGRIMAVGRIVAIEPGDGPWGVHYVFKRLFWLHAHACFDGAERVLNNPYGATGAFHRELVRCILWYAVAEVAERRAARSARRAARRA